jgi:nucleotide-binding universal stress UspA family protein
MVVAHDGRPGGDDAAALARTLAAGEDAAALATIVVPLPPKLVGDPPLRARAGSPDLQALCDDLSEQGGVLLERRARPALQGLRYEARVLLDDSPARALTNLCDLERPDLLIAGSTHRGRIGRSLTGATTDRLLNGSPCPVALAPAGYAAHAPDRLGSVGVGFDGGDDSVRALALAAELALRHRAPLLVLAVAEPAAIGELRVAAQALDALSGRGLTDLAAERLREAAAAALERCPPALRAEVEVAYGSPGDVLLDRSKRTIDLLAVGSRGYGPLRRTLLGSTSTEVARGAACPVVVCPRA